MPSAAAAPRSEPVRAGFKTKRRSFQLANSQTHVANERIALSISTILRAASIQENRTLQPCDLSFGAGGGGRRLSPAAATLPQGARFGARGDDGLSARLSRWWSSTPRGARCGLRAAAPSDGW